MIDAFLREAEILDLLLLGSHQYAFLPKHLPVGFLPDARGKRHC